nr:RNA-directed DNA polymerase, eukaryota, reverse transcriptase zinc-binding domain protein [Tanacetum cinerariifolium]
MAWIKWENVLASFEKGGLNIGSLKSFNLSLLQKWRWRLVNNPDSLWARVIIAIHGMEAGLDLKGCNCNGVWSSIISSYSLLHVRNFLPLGLKINLHKSKLMGIGVSSNVVTAEASLIGCSILTPPFNYLGVKVGSNMSRITSWDDVISKVSSRLSKWKLKLISISGRLSLLKSVLTSILLYHMSIFKVPICVLNHLEYIRRNFFYGVHGLDRKLAWISWNMVLTSKKNGGLGV